MISSLSTYRLKTKGSMKTLLEIRDITFIADDKPVLDHLNLVIQEGEIHALTGTNGTGKSSLARLIMGCSGYHISSGNIFFAQQKIDQYSIQQRASLGISMVWQEPAYFEGISVRDYLSLNKKENLSECLESVGLNANKYLDKMMDKTMLRNENSIMPESDLSFDFTAALENQLRSLLCACFPNTPVEPKSCAILSGIIKPSFLSEMKCRIYGLNLT